MNNNTVLITGGCGFIGSSLAVLLKEKYPAYRIISLDNLKRRGSELNIIRLKEIGIEFIHGDIRNKEDLELDFEPTFIIDAAAEPSVITSTTSSLNYVLNTNLNGTLNTLELAAKYKSKIIFLSTSRIYPIEYLEKIKYNEHELRFSIAEKQELPGISINGINESFLLNKARSFYGFTKLASELILEEYRDSFDLNYVINRCGVVAGPYQMGKVDQGVIALWVAKHYWKKDINYIGYGGTGKQVRDVLHINDLFNLVDYEMQHFNTVNGKTFNVGGGTKSSTSLLELTQLCQEITGNIVNCHSIKETRKGDIPIYITDNSLISKSTNWAPKKEMHNIVSDIYVWIQQNEKLLQPILSI
jgi:CDP-paratose 2-epimerase